jgi:hypothetical protein
MPEARRMTGCAPGNEQCVCLSSEGSDQRNDTWVAQNQAGKTCTGFEGSGSARRRRAVGTLAQVVRDRAAQQNSSLSAARGNRLSNAGECLRRAQAFRPPSSNARRSKRCGWPTSTGLSEPQSETGNCVGARLGRSHPSGEGAGRRHPFSKQTIQITFRGCACHHRLALVGTIVLRPQSRSQGAKPWNPVKLRIGAAQSTPANHPRRASNRTLILCTRSAKPASPTSKVSTARAGA